MSTPTGIPFSQLGHSSSPSTGTYFPAVDPTLGASARNITVTLKDLENLVSTNDVLLTGNQTISGDKIFAGNIVARTISGSNGFSYLSFSYIDDPYNGSFRFHTDHHNYVCYQAPGTNFGVGTNSPAYLLDVNGSGHFASGLIVEKSFVLSGNAPAISTSSGIKGQIAVSGIYLFVATGTNQWGKVALSPF